MIRLVLLYRRFCRFIDNRIAERVLRTADDRTFHLAMTTQDATQDALAGEAYRTAFNLAYGRPSIPSRAQVSAVHGALEGAVTDVLKAIPSEERTP